MIKKIVYIGAITMLISSITSCEKDYGEIDSSVVNNNKFNTEEVNYTVTMTENSVNAVQTDNIVSSINNTYLLGVYKTDYYKKIESSIISQLRYPGAIMTSQKSTDDITNYSTETNIDSIFVLDKVIIKLPYPCKKSSGKDADGNPTFTLEGVLGNTSVPTKLKVFENKSYLNTLNPNKPSEQNVIMSDRSYVGMDTDNLTEVSDFSFSPKGTDIKYTFQRTKMVNNVAETFEGNTSIINEAGIIQKPFLAIPLDKAKMQALIWDKLSTLKSKEEFQNDFRGLIIKTEGDDGSLVPFDFNDKYGTPTLDFYYTITRIENGNFKDALERKIAIPLDGIRANKFEMTNATNPTPANNVSLQGTAGSNAEINILGGSQLSDLKSKKALINNASLTFYVNQTINNSVNLTPKRLILYKNVTNSNGVIVPEKISDSYLKPTNLYGGILESDKNLPQKYTIGITNYISKIISGDEELVPLTLKVYNYDTDNPIKESIVVKNYSWNPKGVTLYNGNDANGDKKVSLKILYSKEK